MATKKKMIDAPATAQDTTPQTTIEATPAVAETPVPKKTRKQKVVEREVAPAPAPKPTKVKPMTPPAEATTEAPVEPAADATPKKRRAKSEATLRDVFAGYVASLEEEGKSGGTIASYKSELVLGGDALGLDTKITDIKPEQVLLFFTSDRVMKKRNGRGKSPLSIDKTRRVVRQALQWAETQKLVEKAPLPELTATH